MECEWTEAQHERLAGLDAQQEVLSKRFSGTLERDQMFVQLSRELAAAGRERLKGFRDGVREPSLCRLGESLGKALEKEGFCRVVTPTIISRSMLGKMTIDESHDLYSQVFWLDRNKCLRPMLAPNLYSVSKDLLRLWEPPVRVFEIGSCFRKESQGNTHLNEFTMLNFVEWGIEKEKRGERLRFLADVVMQAAGLPGYRFEEENSVVYGDTLDVMCGGVEAASGAMGPHVLDGAWGIDSTWVGMGFGLERLLMLKNGGRNVKSYGRSLSYLDGISLKL